MKNPENPLRTRENPPHHIAAVTPPTAAYGQQTNVAIANGSPRVAQLQAYAAIANGAPVVQRQGAQGGLPSNLKTGIESLSGMVMDDVRVHYNSSKPAQLQAHAFAQGSDIHIAAGQEKHLPHEAWHVVQQRQGRVKPTLQLKGVAINDDSALEREADVMGARAVGGQHSRSAAFQLGIMPFLHSPPLQRSAVAQLAVDLTALFQFISKNYPTMSAIETERVIYWNEQGVFDKPNGGILNLKTLKKFGAKPTPMEDAADEKELQRLPDFMHCRFNFYVSLPLYLGGGKLHFRKRRIFNVFQGRGWISDNRYLSLDAGKTRFMLHVILEWTDNPLGPPNPHVTIRNAEMQANLLLDAVSPLDDKKSRVQGLDATKTSFSQGLGHNDRKAGDLMYDSKATMDLITDAKTIGWLKNEVIAAAQAAVMPELQKSSATASATTASKSNLPKDGDGESGF